MEYYELYEVLKNHFDSGKDRAELKELNISIESIPFESRVVTCFMAQRNNSAINISKHSKSTKMVICFITSLL